MMLITVEQARDQARLGDDDASDAEVTSFVEAASQAVMNYIQGPGIDGFTDSAGDIFEDSNGDPLDVPPVIQAAARIMFGYLWRHRDDNGDGAFDRGYLPMPVTALLTPYRCPSLA